MIKHCIQKDRNECGVAVLKMFYDFFEVEISYEEIKELLVIEENGISLNEMLKVLNKLSHFKAYEVSKEKLKEMTPSIFLVEKGKKSHYLVAWKYENGYFYVSDPNSYEILKIKEGKILKYFNGIVIFNSKREVKLPKIKKFKIHKGPFALPYVVLSILESLLISYSMFYLFSISDYTAFKIYYFLIIMFVSLIISIFKNFCFSQVERKIENKYIDNYINEGFLKGSVNSLNAFKLKIKEGYDIKMGVLSSLTMLIPSLMFIVTSLTYFYLFNFYVFISSFISLIIVLILNLIFEKILNKYKLGAYKAEVNLDKYNLKMLSKDIKREIIKDTAVIKKYSLKYLHLKQASELCIFAIRQFSLMIILFFLYLEKVDVYSIFVVTFYFYSFEGVINLAAYLSQLKINKNRQKIFYKDI